MSVTMMACAALAAACGSTRGSTTEPPPPGPSVHDLLTQARKLDLAGQQSEAIARYRDALARDPNSYDAHYGMARSLDLTGDYETAREHFTRALALAPDGQKDQTQRMRAISWTFVGNLASADADFKAVYDRQLAAHNFAAAAEEANELGRLHLESGDLANADSWYRTGHAVAGQVADLAQWQVDLDDLRWAHAQARLAARRGLAPEAHEQAAVVEHLLSNGGNDDQKKQYAYLLGYIAFYLGHYGEVATALATADQQDPLVLLIRAQAADKLGEVGEATADYQRIVQSSAHSINSAFARPIAQRRLSTAPPR